MGKLLFWAILVLAALIVMRIASRKAAERAMAPTAPSPAPNTQPEAMVRCHHCGVHLPRSEALLVNGQIWCCEEHARLGARP